MLEKESSARIASEGAKAAEIAAFQQTISDMQTSFGQTIQDLNTTIGQLNDTIGRLLEENRLLKGPKKTVVTALFLPPKMKTALSGQTACVVPVGNPPVDRKVMKAVVRTIL